VRAAGRVVAAVFVPSRARVTPFRPLLCREGATAACLERLECILNAPSLEAVPPACGDEEA